MRPRAWRRFAAGRLGDFAIDLIGEVVELGLCPLERGGLVAQDALRRAFDALAQLLDSLAGVAGGLGCIVGDSEVDELLGGFEGVGDLVLVGGPHGVEELLGQKRLGLFGVLDGLPHLLEEVVEPLFLLLRAPRLLAGARRRHAARSPARLLAASSCSVSFF